MAAAVRSAGVASGGSSSGTGDRTVTMTPAVGDLIVVYCCVAANTNDTPTCSDNNGSGTYDRIDVMNFAIAGVNYRMSVFIRTALMVNTTSTVITVATGSNTSGTLHAIPITGVTRVGADAVRSKGSQNNQASGGTPTPVLNQSALTTNGTFAAVGSADTTTTPNASWTEVLDTSQSNDTVALETSFRASGFTGTSIAFGATQSSIFCSHAMELDITAPPLTQSLSDSINNLADSLTILLGHAFSFSDDANNLVDGAVKVVGVNTSHADSLQALTDILTQVLGYERALADSEAANWADAHQLLLSQYLALSDNTANLGDAATLQLEHQRQFTDSIAFLSPFPEAIEFLLGTELALTDTINLTDDYSHLLQSPLEFTDTLDALTDSLEIGYGLQITDSDLPAFPSTPILDDFNRPDEGPPPSADWTTGIAEGLEGYIEPGFDVVDNELANSFNDFQQNYWNVEEFGPDCEAYITVKNTQELRTISFVLRLTDVGQFTSNGYVGKITIAESGGGGFNVRYTLYRLDAGEVTGLVTVLTFEPGDLIGNSFGARVIGNTLQVWANLGSGWEQKISTTDATYEDAGFIGLVSDGGPSCRLDDFGGGTVRGGMVDDFAYELASSDLVLHVSDALSLTDSLWLGYGLLVNETVSLTDAFALQGEGRLDIADSFTLDDSESHVLELRLEAAESLSLTDALALGHGLAVGDLITLADSVTLGYGLVITDGLISLSDTYSQQLHETISAIELELDDSLILTDSLTLGVGLTTADALSLDDSLDSQLGQYLTFAETLTITDAAALQLQHLFGFSDSFILLDSQSSTLGYHTLFSDALSLTDDSVYQLGQLLSFSDSINNLTDAYAQLAGIQLPFTDSFSLTDSLLLGYGLVIDDDASSLLDDVLTSAPQGPLRQVGVTDSIDTLTDAVELRLDYLLATADTISLADAIALNEGLLTALADSFILTDTAASTLGHLLPLADSFALGDAIQLQMGQQLAVDDALAFADSIALRLDYHLAASDALSLADAVALSQGLLITLTDVLSLSDAEAAALHHALTLTDSLTFADAIQLRLGYELALTDVVVLSDSETATLSYYLSLSDNAALLADSLAKSLGLTLILNDNALSLTDAVELFSTWLLQFTDTLALTDSLARFSVGFLALDDSFLLTDNVAIDLRGPDFDATLSDSLTLTDAVALNLSNELQLQMVVSDVITLTDHYFDLRRPYTPSARRHIVVPSRARVTTPPARSGVAVPASDRITRVE